VVDNVSSQIKGSLEVWCHERVVDHYDNILECECVSECVCLCAREQVQCVEAPYAKIISAVSLHTHPHTHTHNTHTPTHPRQHTLLSIFLFTRSTTFGMSMYRRKGLVKDSTHSIYKCACVWLSEQIYPHSKVSLGMRPVLVCTHSETVTDFNTSR